MTCHNSSTTCIGQVCQISFHTPLLVQPVVWSCLYKQWGLQCLDQWMSKWPGKTILALHPLGWHHGNYSWCTIYTERFLANIFVTACRSLVEFSPVNLEYGLDTLSMYYKTLWKKENTVPQKRQILETSHEPLYHLKVTLFQGYGSIHIACSFGKVACTGYFSIQRLPVISMLPSHLYNFRLAKPKVIKNFSQPSSLRHLVTFSSECLLNWFAVNLPWCSQK